MSTLVPIIEEAWQHRRRRQLLQGTAAMATLTAAVVVIVSVRPDLRSGSSVPAPTVVAASVVLSRPPYMGVKCPGANSIACDRVGLAVWLKRPAVSVSATIAGAPLVLSHHDEFLWPGDPRHTSFAGYLQPAGIVSRLHARPVDGTEIKRLRHQGIPARSPAWLGEGNAGGSVRLTIHEPGGRTVITHLYVGLRAGWG